MNKLITKRFSVYHGHHTMTCALEISNELCHVHVAQKVRSMKLWKFPKKKQSKNRDTFDNNNLAIANRLRDSCAHNTLKYYTVTLKSRSLEKNHWIDHTRLSSSRVI